MFADPPPCPQRGVAVKSLMLIVYSILVLRQVPNLPAKS